MTCACRPTDLIDGLKELADDERHRLNALDFLLRVKVLLLQVPLLVLDVLLLHRQELKLLLQLLVPRVLYRILLWSVQSLCLIA